MTKLLSMAALVFGVSAAFAAAPAQARNYDCSKPGNADKAACKSAAKTTPPPAPLATTAAVPVAAPKRNYDCSKAGNANKAVCKSTASPAATAAPASAQTPVSRPAVAPAAASTPIPARVAVPAVLTPAAAGHLAGPAVISPTGARIVPWTTKTGKLVHYDCSKAGNATKQACKQ